MMKNRKIAVLGAVASGALMLCAGAVHAQGTSYPAAKAAGQVGEQRDGYLGVVGNQGADIAAMVQDLNNKRKAVYTAKALGKSTIAEYAFTTACTLILQTQPGEKYQGVDGSWKTRQAGVAPERDPKCP